MRYEDSSINAKKDNVLLRELSTYLEWAGIGNPYSKIYITTSNLRYFPIFMFFFTLFQLSKLQWQKNIGNSLIFISSMIFLKRVNFIEKIIISIGTLVWKRFSDPVDGFPLLIGLQTIFRQFHPSNRSQFMLYMSQYLKSFLAVVAK